MACSVAERWKMGDRECGEKTGVSVEQCFSEPEHGSDL